MERGIETVLPPKMRDKFIALFSGQTEELRLRIGYPPVLTAGGGDRKLSDQPVTVDDLRYLLTAASHCSIYAVNESLSAGYITIPGGHRIGFCGSAVMENGKVKTIKDVSSVCVRIAANRPGCGVLPKDSVLIAGPPGCGKTTLLRDCIRRLSEEGKQRVAVVDERGEIAGCIGGVPQFPLGQRTDILSACPKAIAVPLVLRTMTPQWIAVDEITEEADVDAMCRAGYCGTRMLATAHIWSMDDLFHRPVYIKMIHSGIFREVLCMTPDHRWRREGVAEICSA